MFYKIISERAEENDKFKKAICRCRTLFSERPLPCPFSIILSIVSFFLLFIALKMHRDVKAEHVSVRHWTSEFS